MDENKKSKKKMGIILILLLLLVAALVVLGTKMYQKEEIVVGSPDVNVAQDAVDIDEEHNKKRHDADSYIDIPVFSEIYIYEDDPNVYLNNPEYNNVYFQFKVSDTDGNVLYDEDVKVEPGKALPVDFYSILGKGEHEVAIDISTFDIETGETCNGAHQMAKIIAE